MSKMIDFKPRSADEIIAEQNVREAGRISEDKKTVIRTLSQQALSRQELFEILEARADYNTGAGDRLGKKRAMGRLRDMLIRNRRIFGHEDDEWFVTGTIADLNLQRAIKSGHQPTSEVNEVKNPEEIIFEILKENPLSVGQWLRAFRVHPANNPDLDDGTLKWYFYWIMRRYQTIFEKKGARTRSKKWGVKKGITSIPKILRSPQRDSLYTIMSSKWRIRGWTLAELVEAVMRENSDFKTKKGTDQREINARIRSILVWSQGSHFERVGPGRWRIRSAQTGKLKPVSSAADWNGLVTAMIKDEGGPVAPGGLIAKIKPYGSFFGWDTSTLPDQYLQNQVSAALTRLPAEITHDLLGLEMTPQNES